VFIRLNTVKIISAQQLPRPKDANGREITDKLAVDPFVEVTVHVPDWYFATPQTSTTTKQPPPGSAALPVASTPVCARTISVRNNGFNPVWEEDLNLQFDCAGGMLDLVFVKFAVKQEDKVDGEPLAVYCTSLGSLEHGTCLHFIISKSFYSYGGLGFRHLPLHDSQLSQYLFSTLFVRIGLNT
jgi:phosphatidylinositol phospholipase C delta